MTFNPERDGWSLREAVMHTANRSMLAQLHRDMIEAYAAGISFKQPVWWIYRLAPPPAPPRVPPRRVEHLFVYDRKGGVPLCLISELGCNRLDPMLTTGELTCRARPGAPHADYVKVPWVSVQIENWTHGQLIAVTSEVIDGRERSVPVPGGLRYYDARIERPGRPQERKKVGSPGHRCRDRAIAAAVDYLDIEGWDTEAEAVSEAADFIKRWVIQNVEDGGPSAINTYKSWAKTAVKQCCAARRQ